MFERSITNAPHVPRARAFLDTRDMVRHPVAMFERYRARLGPTFTFHFGGARPSLASSDPVFMEHVLKKNRHNYQKSHIQGERMVEFQGKGLVNSHGDDWLRLRRVAAEGFRPSRLAHVLPMQQDVLQELMDGFDRDVRQGPVDVHQQMVRFTLRLVGRSMFGKSMPDEELDQIGDAISAIQSFILRQIVQPYKIPWFRISGQSARHQQLRKAGDAIVLRHIQSRLAEGGSENDLLRVLMETPCHDTGRPMGEAQALIESVQLIVAGNETSSNALSWVFYLLARHPQYILDIRDEIASVIGGEAIDFRLLHQLEGTIRVIDEALRLYPPFWMIDRIALQEDEINGVRIPAGTMVIPYIYGTHRNPAHWEDVESFDPRRFEPDRRKARHPFAYIPFGGGPRTCVGANMAIMQMLMIVVATVRKYDFKLTKDEPIATRPMMLLRPAGPVTMTFRAVSSR
ncbi:MAG: cytochrome P450 [Vicinamibacterales bacterium]